MILHKRRPFDLGDVEVEAKLRLQLIDLILQYPRRRIVKDPFIVHEICELNSNLLALGYILLQFCYILFYLFGAHNSGDVIECSCRQFAFVLESTFIGLICWMSVQTRCSNGFVKRILGPVGLQSVYSIAPGHTIGSRRATVSQEEAAS